jgi:AcrR family transcriptional regulator
MPRPRLHDDALRARLLARAATVLSAGGPDALSLRRLAADVGTSTTAVYSLFGGKPGLVHAVFEAAFRRFAEHLAGAGDTGDPLEDITRLGLAYRRSALADPHLYRVMFGGELRLPAEPRLLALAARPFSMLVTAVTSAVEAGLLISTEPAAIATTLWAMVHGLVSLELGSLLPAAAGDPVRLYEQAIRRDLAGWRAPRSTRNPQ